MLIALPLLIAACAIANIASTPPPPITLSAPTTLMYSGTCDDASTLESWLQKTTFMKNDFIQLVDNAASRPRGEVHDLVQRMAEKLDSASAILVPDCAVEVHVSLIEAMTQAVEVFQAYTNDSASNLDDIVAETKNRMEFVSAIQLDLTKRLEAEYGNQQ